MAPVRIILAFLITLAAQQAVAQEPVARLAKAVTDLGNESHARRQKAEELLIAAGPEATPLLQNAALSRDLEVRSRAYSIIRRRRLIRVWEPTLAEYPGGDVPWSDVLEHFSRTFGSPAAFQSSYAGRVNQSMVRIPEGELPALLALADGADQLGYRIVSTRSMNRHDQFPHVQFGDCRNHIGRSCSGPTMVELTSATQDGGTLHFDFLLFWEPRFELVSYSAEPMEYEITWTDGETSKLTIPVEWHIYNDWANPGRRLKPIHVSARFDGVEPTKKIKRLEIKWPMCAAATVGKAIIGPAQPGDATMTDIGEVVVEGIGQYRLKNIRSWPQPADAVLLNCKWDNGHALVSHAELTDDGAIWQTRNLLGNSEGPVQLDYRTDFSRKDLDFVFEDIPVSPVVPATRWTISDE